VLGLPELLFGEAGRLVVTTSATTMGGYVAWIRDIGRMVPGNRRLWAAVGSVLVWFISFDVWFGNPLFVLVPVLATIHARLPE